MIIGFDVDEVLADFLGPFIDFNNRAYKAEIKKEKASMLDLSDTLKCPRPEVRERLDAFYKSPEFSVLPPAKGSKELIGRIMKKYDLRIVTSRPSNLHEATMAWMNMHFPRAFSGPYFSSNDIGGSTGGLTKAEVCRNIGAKVLVEDHPIYARQCAESGIHVLLVKRKWNAEESFPEGKVTRVDSLYDVEAALSSILMSSSNGSHC